MEEVFRLRFGQGAAAALPALRGELAALLPHAVEIEEIGATAIPGCLTKGDLDVLVRTEREAFEACIAAISGTLHRHQVENWSATYASFKGERVVSGRDVVDVGAQLVVRDSPDDRSFRAFRDRLRADPSLVAQYNTLKRAWDGRRMAEYRAAKAAFVERVVG